MNHDQQFLAQKIRTQYVERELTELDELQALDKTVRRPAQIFGYVFGTVGALVLGAGMSLAMGVIGNAVLPGVLVGCVGIGMVSATYALYCKLLAKRRAKCADRILALSDKIMTQP